MECSHIHDLHASNRIAVYLEKGLLEILLVRSPQPHLHGQHDEVHGGTSCGSVRLYCFVCLGLIIVTFLST